MFEGLQLIHTLNDAKNFEVTVSDSAAPTPWVFSTLWTSVMSSAAFSLILATGVCFYPTTYCCRKLLAIRRSRRCSSLRRSSPTCQSAEGSQADKNIGPHVVADAVNKIAFELEENTAYGHAV
jgi:hypothetical protein